MRRVDSESGPRLSADVFLALHDEGGKLLDFGRGQFFALNAVAATMLDLALSHGRDGAIARLAERFDAQRDQICHDFDGLVSILRRNRLLASSQGEERRLHRLLASLPKTVWQQGWSFAIGLLLAILISRMRRGKPIRSWATLLLRVDWIGLRVLGLSRCAELSRDLFPFHADDHKELLEPDCQELKQIVCETAASMIVLSPSCKECALAALQLLRGLYSAPAVLVFGAQFAPFRIHAWTECDGRVVSDDRERCEQFVRITHYG
jgi:hypothetical protein